MRSDFTQESDFRKQRDFGQKITATFEFIGAQWRGLGRALLYIVLPAAIIQGILSGLMQKEVLLSGGSQTQAEGAAGRMAGGLAAFTQVTQSPYYSASILASGIFLVLMVLTVYVYMNLCLRPGPFAEPIRVAAVWAGVKAEFISSFLSYFGLLIVIIIGMFLLVVPGIYLSVALSIFYVVKVVEGTGFGATVSRSLRLTRGKWWSTLGLMVVMALLLGVCSTAVGAIIGGIVGAIGGGLGLFDNSDAAAVSGVFAVVVSSLSSLFYLAIYPPLLIALAFQYFNLVERVDGVGLHNMVGQLGQAPVPVVNAAYRPDEEGEY